MRVSAAPHLRAITSALPSPQWSTEELLSFAGSRLSPKLADMMSTLGVDTRHSVLANYPDVIFAGADPQLDVSATELSVRSARRCIDKAEISPADIGLVLGVTSSPGRLLPNLASDLVAQLPELSRSVDHLSIAYMGCSAIARVIETARWYLSCNPGKFVMACFMDAITPLSPPLPDTYGHFTEVAEEDRQETVNAMHAFLFGDAAVTMLLSAEGPGPAFGPVVSLTNDVPLDAELGTVPDGGSDVPVVDGRRLYTLSPEVSARGVHYASTTVRTLVAQRETSLSDPADAAFLLMHTGSERILNGLCDEFGVARGSSRVASSYRVLREYGNTIGCSVPLMLAEEVHRPAGEGLVMAFGLSFSCGSFSIQVPEGGWTP